MAEKVDQMDPDEKIIEIAIERKRQTTRLAGSAHL